MTRDEAASALGVTLLEIKRRVAVGDLRTVTTQGPKGGKPQQLVSREDVAFCIQHAGRTAADAPSPSFADRYTPEDASRMFAALKDEASVEDCVIKLRIHPRAAIAIKRAWDEIRGGVTLSRAELDEIEKLGVEGRYPLESPDAVLDVVRTAARDKTCGVCGKRSATTCGPCSVKKPAVSRQPSIIEKGSNGVVLEDATSVR